MIKITFCLQRTCTNEDVRMQARIRYKDYICKLSECSTCTYVHLTVLKDKAIHINELRKSSNVVSNSCSIARRGEFEQHVIKRLWLLEFVQHSHSYPQTY